jgi:hypothetical protein
MHRPRARLVLIAAVLPLLAACEQLGIETPAQIEQKRIAEGKAMGGACRQAGRALEDCYQINPKAIKAAIFEGWREMDAYMRENKLEEIKPEFPLAPPASKKKPLDSESTESKAEKGDAKDSDVKAAKH